VKANKVADILRPHIMFRRWCPTCKKHFPDPALHLAEVLNTNGVTVKSNPHQKPRKKKRPMDDQRWLDQQRNL
jgi:hypothetical protein